MAKKKFGI